MGAFEYIMIYIISWWLLLLPILSFGSDVPEEVEGNAYHSAPKRANIGKKLLVTSLLAVLTTVLIAWAIRRGVFTLWFEPF